MWLSAICWISSFLAGVWSARSPAATSASAAAGESPVSRSPSASDAARRPSGRSSAAASAPAAGSPSQPPERRSSTTLVSAPSSQPGRSAASADSQRWRASSSTSASAVRRSRRLHSFRPTAIGRWRAVTTRPLRSPETCRAGGSSSSCPRSSGHALRLDKQDSRSRSDAATWPVRLHLPAPWRGTSPSPTTCTQRERPRRRRRRRCAEAARCEFTSSRSPVQCGSCGRRSFAARTVGIAAAHLPRAAFQQEAPL